MNSPTNVEGAMTRNFFPDIINRHPEGDFTIDGLVARLIQAGDQQFIFSEFDQDFESSTHTHQAQWTVVLDGEAEVTIMGKTRVVRKGDSYFIDKGVLHSSRIKKGYKELSLSDHPDKYRPKDRK